MTAFADMEKPSRLLRINGGRAWFLCPGCDQPHGVWISDPAPAGERWGYNGNPDAPTFTPSVLCTWPGLSKRCHSYVTDGQIQFLPDCSHGLAGQTAPLPEFDE